MTENNKSKYECLFNIKFSRFFFLQIGIDHRAIKKNLDNPNKFMNFISMWVFNVRPEKIDHAF